MRIRTVKPEFFKDEELAELNPETRLFFIGLWCQVDREGRVEDRPRRLKAEIYPYDDFDAEVMLQSLNESGFIDRYTSHGFLVYRLSISFGIRFQPEMNRRANCHQETEMLSVT